MMFAKDVEAALAVHRYCNESHHACGCSTRFDTLHWRSELTARCSAHQAVNGELWAALDASPGEAK